jgi:hypothetical protein
MFQVIVIRFDAVSLAANIGHDMAYAIIIPVRAVRQFLRLRLRRGIPFEIIQKFLHSSSSDEIVDGFMRYSLLL